MKIRLGSHWFLATFYPSASRARFLENQLGNRRTAPAVPLPGSRLCTSLSHVTPWTSAPLEGSPAGSHGRSSGAGPCRVLSPRVGLLCAQTVLSHQWPVLAGTCVLPFFSPVSRSSPPLPACVLRPHSHHAHTKGGWAPFAAGPAYGLLRITNISSVHPRLCFHLPDPIEYLFR